MMQFIGVLDKMIYSFRVFSLLVLILILVSCNKETDKPIKNIE